MKKLLVEIILLSLISVVAKAQTFTHTQSIIEQENNSSDYFGFDGEFFGDYFVTAAHRQDLDANGQNDINNNGRIYVYKKINGNYALIKSISAPDRAAENQTRFYFGYKVSMHGDFLVASAHHASYDANDNNQVSQAGAAYLFEKDRGGKDNWGFVKKIVAPSNRIANAFFSEDLVINDSILAIVESKAAYYENSSYVDQRWAVHTYHINKGGQGNWGYETTIYQPNSIRATGVWSTIEITQDQLIVGAYTSNSITGNIYRSGGRVFVYNKSYTPNGNLKYNSSQVLNATDDNDINYFGENIKIQNDVMAISSMNDGYDENGNNYQAASGAVYIFSISNGNWSLSKKLVSPVRQSSQWFGNGLGFSGDTLLIAATDFDSTSVDSSFRDAGTVFHFVKGGNNSTWNYKGNFFNGLIWKKLDFATHLYYNGIDALVTSGSSAQNVWIPYRLQVFTKQNVPQAPVVTSIWNGNTWDNGVPNSNTIAQVDADIQISNNTICHELIVNNGSDIEIDGGSILEVRGDITGAATFSGNGTLLISYTQTTVSSSAAITVNNIEIDNDYNLELGGDLTITGNASLTNGHITLGDYDVHVGTSTTFSGAGSDSYLKINGSGVLHATHTRGTTRLFPIGYNPYLPIEITIPSAGNYDNREYEIGLINGAYSNPETQSGLHNANAVNKTWVVNPINLSSSVTVTVQWPLSEELNLFDRTNSSLSVWYQGFGQWFNQPLSAANGTDPYTKTVTNMYFSPYYDLYFGVGSNGSALPVELSKFDAKYSSFIKSAVLNWQTLLEEDNSHFDIERSFDGANWEQIGRVEGMGSKLGTTNYEFIDSQSPQLDVNNESSTIFYRLKQVDYDGAFEYSEVRTIKLDEAEENNIDLWPNPCTGHWINLSVIDDYELLSAEGNVVKIERQVNRIDISILPKGLYFIKNKQGQSTTFLKQ